MKELLRVVEYLKGLEFYDKIWSTLAMSPPNKKDVNNKCK